MHAVKSCQTSTVCPCQLHLTAYKLLEHHSMALIPATCLNRACQTLQSACCADWTPRKPPRALNLTLLFVVLGPPYRYQGCYDDSYGAYFGGDRTLPQPYDNLRTGVGIDECAAAGRARGFPVFALQGYGQCFFGSMADLSRIQGTQKLSDDKCSNLPCPAAAAAANCPSRINKVFFLIGEYLNICLQNMHLGTCDVAQVTPFEIIYCYSTRMNVY
jgi:hypothetical protein